MVIPSYFHVYNFLSTDIHCVIYDTFAVYDVKKPETMPSAASGCSPDPYSGVLCILLVLTLIILTHTVRRGFL